MKTREMLVDEIEDKLNCIQGIILNDLTERRELKEIIEDLVDLLEDAFDYLNSTR